MDTIEVKSIWNEKKGKLKQKFAVLTVNNMILNKRQERGNVWKISSQAWQNNRRIPQYYRSVLILT